MYLVSLVVGGPYPKFGCGAPWVETCLFRHPLRPFVIKGFKLASCQHCTAAETERWTRLSRRHQVTLLPTAGWLAGFFAVKRDTLETAYKVAICSRGNLLDTRIYLITDIKLLWKGVLRL